MDFDKTLNILPRHFNETKVIQLELMRKMDYKKPYMKEYIKPKAVFDALAILIKQPLYIYENITVNTNWSKTFKLDDGLVEFDLKFTDNKTTINDKNQELDDEVLVDEIQQETMLYESINYMVIDILKFA